MKKNVVVLIGVNGAGKSTIAQRLEASVPGARAMSGSEVLMQAFGGLTREQLERLSPEEKMRLMAPTFVETFRRHASARHLFLDTHLVVPIRKDGTLVLENVWSQTYAPHVERIFFIQSSPHEILARRKRDFEMTGRVRDLDLDHIRHDQDLNLAAYHEILAPRFPSAVIVNHHDRASEAADSIRRLLSPVALAA